MKPIKHIKINKEMKSSELVDAFNSIGFQAKKLGKAGEIFLEILKDKDCKKFLGLAGALVPGGMKQIIIDLLQEKKVDVLVSTGANLTHDLIESLGEQHYQEQEDIDEKINDALLNEKNIDRIYNVFMKNSVYGKLEKFFEENWQEIRKCRNIKELLWKLGELVNGKGILGVCWKNKIPIFCPAIADSGIGLMVWGRKMQGKEITIDAFDDMSEIIDLAWTAKKRGVIYLGGGVPKNFIQQSLQFSKGADYGIQITTAIEASGGSSGAPLREGISWGKMNKSGKFVNIFSDVTIALPLLYSYVKDKLK